MKKDLTPSDNDNRDEAAPGGLSQNRPRKKSVAGHNDQEPLNESFEVTQTPPEKPEEQTGGAARIRPSGQPNLRWRRSSARGAESGEAPLRSEPRGARKPSNAGMTAVIAAAIATVGITGYLLFDSPQKEEETSASSDTAVLPKRSELTEELALKLDGALAAKRAGKSDEALKLLGEIDSATPRAPFGTRFLMAKTALDAGMSDAASESLRQSMERGERLSDVLAIGASLGLDQSGSGMRISPKIDAIEGGLRDAISADIANPLPCIELAALLRQSGRNTEAVTLLARARSMMMPVDGHAAAEVLTVLARLEALPDSELPEKIDSDTNVGRRWGAAYVALRRKNNEIALEMLTVCRAEHTPDVFAYLLGDVAFRPYASLPEIKALLNGN